MDEIIMSHSLQITQETENLMLQQITAQSAQKAPPTSITNQEETQQVTVNLELQAYPATTKEETVEGAMIPPTEKPNGANRAEDNDTDSIRRYVFFLFLFCLSLNYLISKYFSQQVRNLISHWATWSVSQTVMYIKTNSPTIILKTSDHYLNDFVIIEEQNIQYTGMIKYISSEIHQKCVCVHVCSDDSAEKKSISSDTSDEFDNDECSMTGDLEDTQELPVSGKKHLSVCVLYTIYDYYNSIMYSK